MIVERLKVLSLGFGPTSGAQALLACIQRRDCHVVADCTIRCQIGRHFFCLAFGTRVMASAPKAQAVPRSKHRVRMAVPEVTKNSNDEDEVDLEEAEIEGEDTDDADDDDDGDDENVDEGDDDDDDDDIPLGGRSNKTKKRKRRAVSLNAFGETLEQLLGTESAPAPNEILSLAPRLRHTANASTLRAKAARLALEKRKEREERAHIKDVIGEWGPPGSLSYAGHAPLSGPALDAWTEQGGAKGYERRLRKTAQRGVVKLFNAIRAAQSTTEDDIERARMTQKSRKVNELGNKDMAVKELSKSHFLDMLRQAPKGTSRS